MAVQHETRKVQFSPVEHSQYRRRYCAALASGSVAAITLLAPALRIRHNALVRSGVAKSEVTR